MDVFDRYMVGPSTSFLYVSFIMGDEREFLTSIEFTSPYNMDTLVITHQTSDYIVYYVIETVLFRSLSQK